MYINYVGTIIELRGRITQVENAQVTLKNQHFELETHLLKALSENKSYVVRKMKEIPKIKGMTAHGKIHKYIIVLSIIM